MYIDTEPQNKLQPYVLFDWRLIAERGLRCYGHLHALDSSKSVASCEIGFLIKMSIEERNQEPRNQFDTSDLFVATQTTPPIIATDIRDQQNASETNTTACQQTTPKADGQVKCVGAVRKAGFLSVKKWILKRKQSIELARKQGWKRYWVCLRGTALLFHSIIDKKDIDEIDRDEIIDLLSWTNANCCGQTQLISSSRRSSFVAADPTAAQNSAAECSLLIDPAKLTQCYIEKEPRHLIIIDGSIAQPIPEHPKREFVFCLSTTFGDAYLFQASCQLESDNWILAIHNACAATIARDLTRDEAIKLFETKLRHLELDSEKKLFLRQRLDSRLTSMSSMSHVTGADLNSGTMLFNNSLQHTTSDRKALEDLKSKRTTMRTLLCRLSQQLHAFDAYLEQIHCEIYQLRCYLLSCTAQKAFYNNLQSLNLTTTTQMQSSTSSTTIDLPHPKSLLIHVSKPTKLLLIKLGVFTVSSFHAYVHARQDSAETILKRIAQQTSQTLSSDQSSQQQQAVSPTTLQLNVRSRSFSESLMALDTTSTDAKLEKDAENLMQLSNIKHIKIRISKQLYFKLISNSNAVIQSTVEQQQQQQHSDNNNVSDDRYSIQEHNDFVSIGLKVRSSSDAIAVVSETLNVIRMTATTQLYSDSFEFLNYYLRLAHAKCPSEDSSNKLDDINEQFSYRPARRKETVEDWLDCNHLELVEKVIFRVDVPRSRMDEDDEALPFGISIEGELISGKSDCALNVYCSYVEWGSAADKAGLRDEDELLMVNGILVAEVDMMFVECVIKDASKLRLVVRSTRDIAPTGATVVDPYTWRRPSGGDDDDDGDNDDEDDGDDHDENRHPFDQPPETMTGNAQHPLAATGSQVISDEYISSLVCPPPPAPSSAFLRTDPALLRQKSDLASCKTIDEEERLDFEDELAARDQGIDFVAPVAKAVSQTNLDQDDDGNDNDNKEIEPVANEQSREPEKEAQVNESNKPVQWPPTDRSNAEDKPIIERLKKSLTELLETEYAYNRHLETIIEHYMNPLEEMSFLNIPQLKELNKIMIDLKSFQKNFSDKLIGTVSLCFNQSSDYPLASSSALGSCDALELLNQVLQRLDLLQSADSFKPILDSMAQLFLAESDSFRLYTSYCVSYSKLQRLLHLRENGSTNLNQSSNIVSIPPTLNTFSNSNGLSISTASSSGGGSQLFRPLSGSFSLGGGGAGSQSELYGQLKQLNEFLGNLDSSSSSASLSFPKSSCSADSQQQQQPKTAKTSSSKLSTPLRSSASGSSTVAPGISSVAAGATSSTTFFQRGVHQQNLESYLIKPIQRIVKYPMLLASIVSCATQMSIDDERICSELQSAIKRLESVIGHVNNTQRTYDEYGHIFSLIERQYLELQAGETTAAKAFSNTLLNSVLVKPHQPPISLDASQLLHAGSVDWLNVQDFTFKLRKGMNLVQSLFVFDSCVVFICKDIVKTTKRRRQLLDSMSNLTQSSGSTFTSATAATNNTNATTANNLTTSLMNAASSTKNSIATKPFGQQNEQSTEIIRYQTLIPVSEVQVRSVQRTSGPTDCDGSSKQFQWELFHCSPSNPNSSLLTKAAASKRAVAAAAASGSAPTGSGAGKVYLLSSASNEDRNAFLRKIRFTIRESVRNMSLPLARSPSTKSCTTPKKVSSPSSNNTTANSSCSQSTSLSPTTNCSNGSCEQHRPHNNRQLHFTGVNSKQEKLTCPTSTANSATQQTSDGVAVEFRFGARRNKQQVNSDRFASANTVKVNN